MEDNQNQLTGGQASIGISETLEPVKAGAQAASPSIKPTADWREQPASNFKQDAQGRIIMRDGFPVRRGGKPRKQFRPGEKRAGELQTTETADSGQTQTEDLAKGDNPSTHPDPEPSPPSPSTASRVVDPEQPATDGRLAAPADPQDADSGEGGDGEPNAEPMGEEAGRMAADAILEAAERKTGIPPTNDERATIKRQSGRVFDGITLGPIQGLGFALLLYGLRVLFVKAEGKGNAHAGSRDNDERQDHAGPANGPSGPAFEYPD